MDDVDVEDGIDSGLPNSSSPRVQLRNMKNSSGSLSASTDDDNDTYATTMTDDDESYATGFWQQYSAVRKQRIKKRLMTAAVVVCGLIVMVALLIGGFAIIETHSGSSSSDKPNDNNNNNPDNGDPKNNTNTDNTPEDIKRTLPIYAKYVLDAMDRSANPCNDFYQYSCGGWFANTTLPPEKSSMSRSFTKITDDSNELIRTLLEDDWPLVSPFYKGCLDNATRESRGVKPLDQLFQVIQAINDPTTLVNAIAALHLQEIRAFFDFDIVANLQDPTTTLAAVDESGTGLPSRDYYFNNDTSTINIRAGYKNYMAALFKLSGQSDADAATSADVAFSIEKQLAGVMLSPAQRRDPYATYHVQSFSDLLTAYPRIDWEFYLNAINVSLARDEKMNVATPEFMHEIDVIFNNILASGDYSNVKTYLMWQVLRSTAGLLTPAFNEERYAFSKILYGSVPPPMWKQCVGATSDYLGFILGHLYVLQRFPGDSKRQAKELIKNIESEFQEIISNTAWMDFRTREKSLNKLYKITNKIGYPDVWPMYEGITVRKDNYFEAAMALRAAEKMKDLAKLHKPTDRTEWEMFPQTVNAYYRPDLNEIVFPAGILQPPFFKQDFLNSMNYGGIGVVIGHEITHGFDDEGRNFDGDGKLVSWWSNQTSTAFTSKAQCVDDQYSAYTVNDGALHVNGKLTLGENIADNGGVRQAYGAFKKTTEKADEAFIRKTFEGITNDQLFFISFAQVWCSIYNPQSLAWLVNTNPHSPAQFRVTGPVQNSAEFARAFECPAAAPMNPASKCVVWG